MYTDARSGPIRSFDNPDECIAYMQSVEDAILLLQDAGYQIVDQYGRTLAQKTKS